MIRFRRWREHNRRALKDVADKREKRGIPRDAPLAMQKVLVVVHLDAQFADFADRVGGAVAETYFLRSMQYAAEHDGHDGSIRVSRERFGPTVLGRPWQMVSKETGKKVYDALLKSTICVPIDAPPSADVSADESSDGPRTDDDSSADGACSVRGQRGDRPPGQGGALPPPLPGEQGGDSRSRGYARVARAASNPASGPQTGPRSGLAPPSPLPSDSLPDLPEGKGRVASPPTTSETATARTAARQRIRDVVAGLDDVARASHDATIDAIEDAVAGDGWTTLRRQEPGDVDLAIETPDGATVFVEVDRKSPRERSKDRLRDSDGLRVVVLREEPDERVRIDGVDVLVAGRRAPKPVEQCPRHGRAKPCTTCDAIGTKAVPAPAEELERMRKAVGAPRPVAEKARAEKAPALSEHERTVIRLRGDLGAMDTEQARALLAEKPHDAAWVERATALLDPLSSFEARSA